MRPLGNDFGYWLSGLIDGEGSFQIVPNRPGFVCRLNVGLRDDDHEILSLIVQLTGLGRLVSNQRPSRSDGSNRQSLVHWRVERKFECQEAVEMLRAFPLRTKKQRDFEIWAQAVELMRQMDWPVVRGGGRDWSEVSKLKAKLSDVRRHPLQQPRVEGSA